MSNGTKTDPLLKLANLSCADFTNYNPTCRPLNTKTLTTKIYRDIRSRRLVPKPWISRLHIAKELATRPWILKWPSIQLTANGSVFTEKRMYEFTTTFLLKRLIIFQNSLLIHSKCVYIKIVNTLASILVGIK